MTKCEACKINEATWAWQPFGPGEQAYVFTTLGSHYRGFPVIKVCADCQKDAAEGLPIEFDYKDTHYIGNTEAVHAVPKYVMDGDPLLWWEETC